MQDFNFLIFFIIGAEPWWTPEDPKTSEDPKGFAYPSLATTVLDCKFINIFNNSNLVKRSFVDLIPFTLSCMQF